MSELKAELLPWLHVKLAEAEKALSARVSMEESWRGGSDESWKAVGCKMNKAQRLKESEMHGRIAVKCRRDVEMFKAVISAAQSPWIPVGERLPENDEKVFVSSRTHDWNSQAIFHGGRFWGEDDDGDEFEIIDPEFWILIPPLPLPPIEKGAG